MSEPLEIRLPYNWEPRDYQAPLWTFMRNGGKRACVFWHRRAGKDLSLVNIIQCAAMERVGAYWHVFPTYRQGKKIAWEGKTRDGRPFRDHFHPKLIERKRDQELTLDFINPYDASQPGSTYSIVGADNPDSQVGTNPIGIVFSEWALYESPEIWNRLQPILAENDGWAVFITTPRGRNFAYQMYKDHLDDPTWFTEVLSYKDTNAITEEAVKISISEGMSEAMAAQEYECSFDAQLENAYFGEAMVRAAEEGRIGHFPHDDTKPVETWWDIGHSDDTSVWFVQKHYGQYRAVDFESAAMRSFPEWIALLNKKRDELRYNYSEHLLPHDAKVTEWGTGQTRVERFYESGYRNVRVVTKIAKADQIQAARSMIGKMQFHEEKCARGLEALRQYQRKQIPGILDDRNQPVYSEKPLHNWASNPADAFQTGSVGSREHRFGEPSGEDLLAPELAIV